MKNIKRLKPVKLPNKLVVVNCVFCFRDKIEYTNRFSIYAYNNSNKYLLFKCENCGKVMRYRTPFHKIANRRTK